MVGPCPLAEVLSQERLIEKFIEQARWSQQVVDHFWPEPTPALVCDIGCGPSAEHLKKVQAERKLGIDLDLSALRTVLEAPDEVGEVEPIAADALQLPFPDKTFDVVFSHYLLMWVPIREACEELWRLVKPGGTLLCASEPDHTRRTPAWLADLSVKALELLGARPDAGARIERELTRLPDTAEVECGILEPIEDRDFQLATLEEDLMLIEQVLRARQPKRKKKKGKKKDDPQDEVDLEIERRLEEAQDDPTPIFTPVHYGCARKADEELQRNISAEEATITKLFRVTIPRAP